METIEQKAIVQTSENAQLDDLGTMYVAFSIGSEEFGVNALNVREIKTRTDITRVPGARSYIRGVVNLRGKIIPVFSVSERLNMVCDTEHQKTIVFVESSRGDAGLLVDKVTDVITLNNNQIEYSSTDDITFQGYTIGTGKLGSRLITLLETERILGINE